MGKFSGVLIATDMDGTLLGRDHAVSEPTRRAIEYFTREGGLFSVSTGRSPLGFESVRPTVSYNAPCILSNGAVLYDYSLDKALYVRNVEGDYMSVLRHAFEIYPKVGIEFHMLWEKSMVNPNEQIARHLKAVGCTAKTVARAEDVTEPFIKIIFVDHEDVVSELSAELIEKYGTGFTFVCSNPWMLEMQNTDTHKGSGVAQLARLLGVRSENVYTAGDAGNDIAMMTAFESFAPANATPEAKSAADHLMPDCDEHTIAAVIEFLDRRY